MSGFRAQKGLYNIEQADAHKKKALKILETLFGLGVPEYVKIKLGKVKHELDDESL